MNLSLTRLPINMNPRKLNLSLQKSKSLCSLQSRDQFGDKEGFTGYRRHSRTISDSSVEMYLVESETDDEDRPKDLTDSGVEKSLVQSDIFESLKHKIDKLSEMFIEQCGQLSSLNEEIRSFRNLVMEDAEYTPHLINAELMKIEALSQRIQAEDAEGRRNSRGKVLLDAIESQPSTFSLNQQIQGALTSFLQSDELKAQMVQATADSLKGVVGGWFSRDVSSLYLPVLEHSHRRLQRQVARVVDQAFIELETHSAVLSRSVHRTTRNLKRALEQHQSLLQAAETGGDLENALKCTVEEILHKELKEWRQKVLDMVTSQLSSEAEGVESPKPPIEFPGSPPQPADPEISIIDQLMRSAEITKRIQDGDVNGAFEAALSAAELSQVEAACRAAEPGGTRRLSQPVLLSLLQQLATDMVHDTQLKCRYLEEAILNLNASRPDTRAHLPLVVSEVRKHLTRFLTAFPSHVASRRIRLIIMAADNLLK